MIESETTHAEHHDSSQAEVSPWAALMGKASGAETKYSYDAEVDIAYIGLKDRGQIMDTDDTTPGVVVDLDAEGNAVGFEIFDFSRIAHKLGFISIGVAKKALVMQARTAIEKIILEESDIFTK